MDEKTYKALLNAYPYEIVYVDREHTVRWMNKVAERRYQGRVQIGQSIFNCHNESSRKKIEEFLRRADEGADEMYEAYNKKTTEREFFVPVRAEDGTVIGYFERHEICFSPEQPEAPVGDYWKKQEE